MSYEYVYLSSHQKPRMGFKYLLTVFLALIVVAKADLLNIDIVKGLFSSRCNLFSGEWDFDSSFNPIYDTSTCPFIDLFDCQSFGRPDKQYLKYAWKPTSCKLPRFNGAELLRRWKGKKIMFVGDSICLNQWISLACMLHAAVPKSNITFIRQDPISISTVKFEDYDVTIFLHTSRYLVDVVSEPQGRILKLDSIHRLADSWKGMDMLIFGTWHWWTWNVKEWDFIQDGSNITKDMDRMAALTKGLTTWGRWVDQNINPSKTKVFFQGVTPDHYVGQEWGSNSNCLGEEHPINGTTYPRGRPETATIVDSILSTLKNPVYLLNITTLSQLRIDAHPSIYTRDGVNTDCTHWCLPGLPDTWNQLLYAVLVS